MNHYKISIIFALACMTFNAFCQSNQKNYTAIRTSESPKIDGIPFEKVWDNAELGLNFVMLQPDNGVDESKNRTSSIKILYDYNSIYVATFLYDDMPEDIDRQFSQRDQTNVQADLFSFWINTYNNQIDQTRFYVTAAGAIADSKATNGHEDFGYDVVFNGRSSINENGWYVEMEIPYQALRFPKAEIQNWSFNT